MSALLFHDEAYRGGPAGADILNPRASAKAEAGRLKAEEPLRAEADSPNPGILTRASPSKSNAGSVIRNRMAEISERESLLRRCFATNTLAPKLAEMFNASRVWLFGSVARGEAGSNSDIDILVEGGENLTVLERLKIAANVVSEVSAPYGVDVVVLTKDEIESMQDRKMIRSVLSDRVLIYE